MSQDESSSISETLKYIDYSIEDLRTARDIIEEKIATREGSHFLRQLNNHTRSDLIGITQRAFMITGMITVTLIIVTAVIFFSRNPGFFFSSEIEPISIPYKWLLITAIPGIPFILLGSLLNDGTRAYRSELTKIKLALQTKLRHNSSNKFLLDTNILDDIESGKVDIEVILKAHKQGSQFFITHIQVDEVNKMKDVEKRGKLFFVLSTLPSQLRETDSVVLGVSRWDYSKWGTGEVMERLRVGKTDAKSAKDALIGETAVNNNLTLITNDRKLMNRVRREGCSVLTGEEFLTVLKRITNK